MRRVLISADGRSVYGEAAAVVRGERERIAHQDVVGELRDDGRSRRALAGADVAGRWLLKHAHFGRRIRAHGARIASRRKFSLLGIAFDERSFLATSVMHRRKSRPRDRRCP